MKKIIAWENWSEIEKELTDDMYTVDEIDDEEQASELEALINNMPLSPLISDVKSYIYTPSGQVSCDSKLKPSDRWDCWMGYTNFGITNTIENKIKNIDGIDALKVMSRYSFCIGIGKLFKFTDVRRELENVLCK